MFLNSNLKIMAIVTVAFAGALSGCGGSGDSSSRGSQTVVSDGSGVAALPANELDGVELSRAGRMSFVVQQDIGVIQYNSDKYGVYPIFQNGIALEPSSIGLPGGFDLKQAFCVVKPAQILVRNSRGKQPVKPTYKSVYKTIAAGSRIELPGQSIVSGSPRNPNDNVTLNVRATNEVAVDEIMCSPADPQERHEHPVATVRTLREAFGNYLSIE